MLQLTPKANGLQGGFSIPDGANGATVTNMTANFKLFIGKGSGNAADGFSFNFASDIAVNNTGEEGTGSGIIVSFDTRSEEHTSELQSRFDLVCRLLLEKKN